MAAFFQQVKGYETCGLPVRKTAQSAGYDFFAAEDIVIPPYEDLCNDLVGEILNQYESVFEAVSCTKGALTLDEISALTKTAQAKPTLIPTGVKCHLDSDTFLQLSIRSSSPLKYWIILANGVGIIDADYYNNPDNEGEIFFQIINLSPFPIQLQKGEKIGQGIIKNFIITEDDAAVGNRAGGFGSTSQN